MTTRNRKPSKDVKPKRKKGVTQPGEMTIPAIAAGIGVSTITIHKYIKRGCPRTSIEAVHKWRAENIKAVAEDCEVTEIGIECKRAEVAERWENARARQLKNDEKEGRLVSRAAVGRMHGIVISRLTNRLKTLGMKCANLCPAELKATIKEAVEDTVDTALKEFINEFSVDRI